MTILVYKAKTVHKTKLPIMLSID